MASVIEQIPYNEYTANGVATVYPFEFELLQAADLVVSFDGVPQPDSIFTLAGVAVQEGGTVTFDVAPTAGVKVLLERRIALERTTDYQTNGDLRAPVLNLDFKRVWQALQQQGAAQESGLRAPFPEVLDQLPAALDRRGLQLLFHPTTGQPYLAAPVSGTAADVLLQLAGINGSNFVGDDFTVAAAAGTVAAALRQPKAKQTVDFATIGTDEQLTNGGFTGSAAGWALSNFTYSANTITHAAGTVGTASQSLTLGAYRHYKLTVTLTTTTRGLVDFRFDGVTLLDDTGFYVFDPSTNTYSFPVLSGAADTADFSVVTDAAWAGSIDSISLIEITEEMPLTFTSVPTDDTQERIPNGLKLGRYNAGVYGFGDRMTLAFNTTAGIWNTAVGPRALQGNVSGIENTAVGAFAGRYTQTNYGTYIGYSAGKYNTLGQFLTFVGFKAGGSNTTGNRNDAFGYHTLLQSTSGSDNVAMGYQSLYNVLTTSGNTAVGSQTALNCRGSQNTFLGSLSGLLNASAATTYTYSFGTMIGSQALVYGESGTALGFNAMVGADGAPVNNAMALGAQAMTRLANSGKIGNSLSDVNISGRLHYKQPLGGDNTAAGVTIPAGSFLSALFTRSGPGAPFSDTTPTAAAIVATIPGCEVGSGCDLYYRNTSGVTMTLVAGAGITLVGTTTVAAGQTRLYKIIATNVGAGTEAVTVVGISTAAN